MNLRSRIDAMERQIEERGITATCPACGGPSPGYTRIEIYGKGGIELFDRCPKCGLRVNEDGQAVSCAPLPRHGPAEKLKLCFPEKSERMPV